MSVAMGSQAEAAEALAQRLLDNLAHLLTTQYNIQTFEIIPVETNNSNKSPLFHIDEHLGIESWCVKYIYSYAYNKLMQEFFVKNNSRKVTRNNCDEVNTLSMGVLLFNPDVMTFWNKRREMILKTFLDLFDELRFTKIVLSHKPKSNEVFAYRRWLLKRYFSDPSYSFVHLLHITADEASLTESCAEKCPNNYHAWSHRIWLMRLITEDCRYDSIALMNMKYLKEFMNSEQWVSTHISDYSGLQYRQFCLSNVLNIHNYFELLDCRDSLKLQKTLNQFLIDNLEGHELTAEDDIRNERKMVNLILGVILDPKLDLDKYLRIYQNICLLIYELHLNEQLCNVYVSHETLWCHRRFIIQQLVTLIFDYFGESKPKINNSVSLINEKHISSGSTSNITHEFENMYKNVLFVFKNVKEPKILKFDNHSIYNSFLYKALLANERKFIDQRSKAGDLYSEKYEVWLRIVLKFSV